MNRLLTTTACALAVALAAAAQTATIVIDRAIDALNAAGGITATYTITGTAGTMTGRVAMRGNRFAMLSGEAKCWFDGKTQWAYSVATGEVNITEPTVAELQMTNPMATLRAAKTEFIPTLINKMMEDGTASVSVLATESKWFGVTYAADRQGVVDKFAELHATGVYPDRLF